VPIFADKQSSVAILRTLVVTGPTSECRRIAPNRTRGAASLAWTPCGARESARRRRGSELLGEAIASAMWGAEVAIGASSVGCRASADVRENIYHR
jgi:hypothetical protein